MGQPNGSNGTAPFNGDVGLQRTIRRVIGVIEHLAGKDGSVSVRQIAEDMGVPKSAVQRILSALHSEGLVLLDDESGSYRLSGGIYRLVTKLEARLDLRAQAARDMRRLRDLAGETVGLMVREGRERVCLESLEGRSPIRVSLSPGQRVPLYCGGSAKLLLAAMNDADIQQYLSSVELVPFTEGTITDPSELLAEIERIREQGYATSFGEHDRGMYSVAAPISDYTGSVVGAIVVAGARSSIDESDGLPRLIDLVCDAATNVSVKLGAVTAAPRTVRDAT